MSVGTKENVYRAKITYENGDVDILTVKGTSFGEVENHWLNEVKHKSIFKRGEVAGQSRIVRVENFK